MSSPQGRRHTLAQRAGHTGPQVAHPLDRIRDQREHDQRERERRDRERPRRGDAAGEPGDPPPATVAPQPRGAVPRHCWVVDCDYAPGSWPALLVQWRLDPDGWQGRVLLAIPERAGPVVVEAWVPSTQLRPTFWAPATD